MSANHLVIDEYVKKGIVKDLPSSGYHGLSGTYSSTQIKDALKDIEAFHAKYIAKTIAKEEGVEAFDVGTYFHTAVLEPHLIEAECCFFDGVRRGAAWENFKKENPNKAILSMAQKEKGDLLVNAVKNSPIAMARIKRGSPEVSAFLKLVIVGHSIYAPDYGLVLDKHIGWKKSPEAKKAKGTVIVVKVRADLLADNFILDLKSTSGNVKNKHEMATKVSNYNYDLSAALYLDVFTAVTGRRYNDFIWTFASKDNGICKNWTASEKNIKIGRAKYMEGLYNIADGIESNWAIEDSMGILDPSKWEEEWLKEPLTDLI